MKIKELDKNLLNEFIQFCIKHRKDVDDSNLYDEDLKNFSISENPTYLVIDENDNIVAAASLMLDDYYKNCKEARFRIFYSEVDDNQCYEMLLEKILKHTDGLKMMYVFVPSNNSRYVNHVKALKFNIYRYSLFLMRQVDEQIKCDFPQGYSVKTYKKGDEQIWCDIRNSGFTKLKGSETALTPQDVEKSMNSDDHIENGAFILYHNDKPIGTVCGLKDEEDGEPVMEICTLALITEYRGKGLGRLLLRYAMNFARTINYKKVALCVNSENENAKTLYLHEGFEVIEEVVCYKYGL